MTTRARPIAATAYRSVEHTPDLGSREVPSRDDGRRLGRAFVFLWFLIGGIAHFVATETEVRLVPPYIPWPLAAVLVSGGFELLGAVGLLFLRTRHAAGVGLFVLTICVTRVRHQTRSEPNFSDSESIKSIV